MTSAGRVQVLVDGVGHGAVGEREGVGVFAEGGRGVGVAQAGLGLEDLSAGDEERGHAVPQAVEAGAGDGCGIAELGEAATEDLAAQALVMSEVGGEGPRTKTVAARAALPGGRELVSQVGGRGAQGQDAAVAGLGCGQLAGRDGALDAQHPRSEVIESQGRQLAAAGAGVGGEPDQEQVLLGAVQLPRTVRGLGRVAVVVGVGFEQRSSAVVSSVRTALASRGRRGSGRAGPRIPRSGCTVRSCSVHAQVSVERITRNLPPITAGPAPSPSQRRIAARTGRGVSAVTWVWPIGSRSRARTTER